MQVKFILLFLSALIFIGCQPKVNLPQISDFPPKRFIIYKQNDGVISQIFVTKEGRAIRFAWFDIIGIPISKKILINGEFKNDGFLPPNKLSQKIFLNLLENIKEKDFIINIDNKNIYRAINADIYE